MLNFPKQQQHTFYTTQSPLEVLLVTFQEFLIKSFHPSQQFFFFYHTEHPYSTVAADYHNSLSEPQT